MRLTVIIWACVAVLAGVFLAVGIEAANRLTSTDGFCTSCHAMKAYIAADPFYQKAPHQTGPSGMRAGCKDCHIAATDLVGETWTHAKKGVMEWIALMRFDYDDPKVWASRRVLLARHVRDEMLADNSAACRNCHELALTRPKSRAGRAAHAFAAEGTRTCIQCHFNLVHRPVAPRLEFIRGPAGGR